MFAGENLELDGSLSFDPDGDTTTQPVFKWSCKVLGRPCRDLVGGRGRLKIDQRNKVSVDKGNLRAGFT